MHRYDAGGMDGVIEAMALSCETRHQSTLGPGFGHDKYSTHIIAGGGTGMDKVFMAQRALNLATAMGGLEPRTLS